MNRILRKDKPTLLERVDLFSGENLSLMGVSINRTSRASSNIIVRVVAYNRGVKETSLIHEHIISQSEVVLHQIFDFSFCLSGDTYYAVKVYANYIQAYSGEDSPSDTRISCSLDYEIISDV